MTSDRIELLTNIEFGKFDSLRYLLSKTMDNEEKISVIDFFGSGYCCMGNGPPWEMDPLISDHGYVQGGPFPMQQYTMVKIFN